MKVLFLDIDGVLNSVKYDRERTREEGNIDKSRLPLVKRIIDETGAKLVLSSSWRRHWDKDPCKRDRIGDELNSVFVSAGMDIFDKTPISEPFDRAGDIRRWLEVHRDEVESYVIIDDIFIGWGELSDRLVRTNSRIGRGLEEEHVEKAIGLLNNN